MNFIRNIIIKISISNFFGAPLKLQRKFQGIRLSTLEIFLKISTELA